MNFPPPITWKRILGYTLAVIAIAVLVTMMVLLGQYQKQRDWNLAIKASLGGLAGWGIATVLQLGGSLLILALFIWQALKG